MIDLQTANSDTIEDFSRQLYTTYRHGQPSFEAISQVVVEEIFKTFRQADDNPTFGLVRIYRLTKFDELTPALAQSVDTSRQKWITLMGTVGVEPAWCQRLSSQGHQAVPLGENQSPMVSAALYQLGLDIGIDVPISNIDLPMQQASFMTRYFHVEQALGSPYIPAQDGFVVPYGIQSVVGLGNGFMSGSLYILLAFSRLAINPTQAMNFAHAAPFIGTLLANYDTAKIWTEA
jgi:hypothetical protein